MRVRSWHFVLTGGLGGLVGFALMEAVAAWLGGGGSRLETVGSKAIYFAGFGMAVGAALGMTEGYVRKDRRRLLYGLLVGLILGAAGGAGGGAAGQTLYGLFPVRYAGASNADLAIALDSSASMKILLFGGNDPGGKRKKAASRLVDRLSSSDRVAIIDFDGEGRVLLPLTALDGPKARRAAKAAIARIDDSGDTSLDAGLSAALGALLADEDAGRPRHVIFLTDGIGAFNAPTIDPAIEHGIAIHTVGLGSEVDRDLLAWIAQSTGGGYYPVADASDLIAVFERIFSESLDMTVRQPAAVAAAGEQLTHPALHFVLRIVSWALMGLALGFGQGVRENTREDLRACSLGGLFGGALGGALFNPVGGWIDLGAGLVGRALADVVVGAAIGGTMRLAQVQLVEASGKPTTTLLRMLPAKPPSPAPAAGGRAVLKGRG